MEINYGYKVLSSRNKQLWSFIFRPDISIRYTKNKWMKPKVKDTLLWICPTIEQAKY